mgnify:CR=1|jgi:hypothetical protein
MNIFTLLDNIKKRPDMFIRNQSLKNLEILILGYYIGLSNHKIVEDVPEITDHFQTWIYHKYGWSTSAGWAHAIETHAKKQKPLNLFFKIIDEYRQIKLTVLAQVELSKNHQPTGKKVIIGFDTKMDKPLKIEIVKYTTEKLYFLRFYYKNNITNGRILMKPDGSYNTSLNFAKNWAKEELQIKHEEWNGK